MFSSFVFLLCFYSVFLECFAASVKTTVIPEKELECFSQEKIYHQPTDKCYKLLTKGPCPRGHWFVLEKPKETLRGISETSIKGTCVREKCREGEYYWKSTNTCVQNKDKRLFCGDSADEELLTNVFGEGECVCARDPPRARINGDKRMRCYPLYTQGPCPNGQVLGYVGRSEHALCISDQCYSETVRRRRNRTLAKDGVLAPWDNGTCYELGTRGPCPEGLTFKVHPKNKKPNCGSLLNQIFGGLSGCVKDMNGICQQTATNKKAATADRFMKELQTILNKKK